ncbi:MAG: glycosyltransferase family 9 protein [Gammaproteobacteria bacterium]|nr:glycosyltransferase family 9 protein [Gammaproteobacteria bacterium]
MKPPLKKVLVIRNDKLGDFMLAFPAFQILKNSLPEVSLTALVPKYTQEMAQACKAIDQVIIDPGPKAPWREQLVLIQRITSKKFDAVVTLFSTTRIGFALFAARIPYRLAPATKAAQMFYNHRLTQRRSRSEKPEFEYNNDLIKTLLRDFDIETQPAAPPYLQFPTPVVEELRNVFCRNNQLDPQHPLIFIHPGSGGSANNLRVEQYATLVKQLHANLDFSAVITAGPNELPIAKKVASDLQVLPHAIYHSTEGLAVFAQHIRFADLFISSSTGPLHIAGALDVPTAGFYTRRRSATSLRWQTLNSPDNRLAFSPPEAKKENDMSAIDIADAVDRIREKFFSGSD